MEFSNDSGAPLPRVSNLRRRKAPTLPISSCLYDSDSINTSGGSNHEETEIPYLMLTEEMRKGFLKFVNLNDSSIQCVSLPSVFHGARCVGSCLGWLFMAVPVRLPVKSKSILPEILTGKKKMMIENYLFNPLLKTVVQLPSRMTHYSYHYLAFRRFRLSSTPTSDNIADRNCIVAIIPDTSYIALCRPGDASWTELGPDYLYVDIIFHNRKLNALMFDEKLAIINVFGGGERTIVDMIPPPDRNPGLVTFFGTNGVETFLGDIVKQYLVESDEELLMVLRFSIYLHENTDICPVQTVCFKVYKYCDVGPKWDEIENLGDKMIFLGLNASKCYSAIDFPGFVGDSIYFTDDNYQLEMVGDEQMSPCNDLGVYRLSKGRVDPCVQISLTPLNFRSLWHEPSFKK